MASLFTHPTAWVNLYLLLDDFGQPEPDKLITLSGRPLSFRVEANSFQDADTAEVVVDLEDFPFDPRILRGATVEIFLAFSDGVDAEFWENRTPDEVRQYALFAGVLDESESTFDDEHRKFKLRCRDYTAYFLDAELEPGELSYKQGGADLSLTQLLELLIAQRETTQAITVEDPDGVGAQIFPARYKRREGDGKKGSRKTRNGESIWDVVQELALEAGVLVYVDLDRVVIREPATLFVGATGDEREIVYTLGHDVQSVRNARRLGRQNGINVLVTSYDVDAKKTLRAVSPKDAGQEEKVEIAAGDVNQASRKTSKTTRVSVRPFVVRGITDQTQLQRIADQLREQIRHHELEAEIVVDAPTSTNDLLVQTFTYGDPVTLRISEDVQGVGFRTLDDQVRALVAKGYPDTDAKKIALALDDLKLPFYLHRATYRFDGDGQDGGFDLALELRGRKQVEVGE